MIYISLFKFRGEIKKTLSEQPICDKQYIFTFIYPHMQSSVSKPKALQEKPGRTAENENLG